MIGLNKMFDSVIIFHVITVLIAFVVSFFVFFHKKGTKRHKALGWIFVVTLGLSALSTFLIQSEGKFSFIHILSVFTLYWLVFAVLHARRKQGNWKQKHIRHMTAAYIAILSAGMGVLVRHLVSPGNTMLGLVATLLTVMIVIPVSKKLSKSHLKQS